jgi:hypothetical protein
MSMHTCIKLNMEVAIKDCPTCKMRDEGSVQNCQDFNLVEKEVQTVKFSDFKKDLKHG